MASNQPADDDAGASPLLVQKIPVVTPLPCYAVELNLYDPVCQRCPHLRNCTRDTGSRRDKVPLKNVEFKLIPPKFAKVEPALGEDPELVHIDAVYSLCHQTVFGKHVRSNLRRTAPQIALAAAQLNCSIRLYILAAMVGHQQAQLYLEEAHGAVNSRPFSEGMLVTPQAATCVENYAHVCRSQFGTFTLSAVDLLHETNLSDRSMEAGLLRSEVIAGKFIAAVKAGEAGLAEPELYARYEFDLDEHWLALEPSYVKFVLNPPPGIQPPEATAALKRKRFDVRQTMAFMKRHRSAGFAAHMARNSIMPAAVMRVLAAFRLDGDMLEVTRDPVTDSFEFWKELGRAVQTLRCLRMYYGPHIDLF